MVIEVRN